MRKSYELEQLLKAIDRVKRIRKKILETGFYSEKNKLQHTKKLQNQAMNTKQKLEIMLVEKSYMLEQELNMRLIKELLGMLESYGFDVTKEKKLFDLLKKEGGSNGDK